MAKPKTRRRRLSRTLKRGLAVAGCGYLLVCLGLWHYQTRMIFFPDDFIKSTPSDVGLLYEDVWLVPENKPKDGQVHGWWISSRSTASEEIPVILFFHGNGSNLGDLVSRAQQFNEWGYSTMLIDYRGYGRSSGSFPSEQQVYEDAEMAWDYLIERQQIPAENIAIYGHSIGGAIAINLASKHPDAAALIVESSFTSMRDMVAHAKSLPFIPVNWLLTQKFDSIEKVKSLQVPALFIHGDADDVVPLYMSRKLYHATPQAKTYLQVKGAGHSGLPAVDRDLYANTVRGFVEKYAE